MIDFDPTGDTHYDVASAFIKSLRGSDPDAALYWGFRMLESGEDPRFLCRRMMIFVPASVNSSSLMLLPSSMWTRSSTRSIHDAFCSCVSMFLFHSSYRLKMRQVLCPPKPMEFDIATFIG
ncbi:MAG: hypothetical protein ACJ8CB_04860 [Ktedonobacteraceae bacterium]